MTTSRTIVENLLKDFWFVNTKSLILFINLNDINLSPTNKTNLWNRKTIRSNHTIHLKLSLLFNIYLNSFLSMDPSLFVSYFLIIS